LIGEQTAAAVGETQVARRGAFIPDGIEFPAELDFFVNPAFAIGYQSAQPALQRGAMAGEGSFGHDGFNGSIGFAQPRHELGFGFVSDHICPLPGDPAVHVLVEATVDAATAIS
jgi:hypothetical protein